MNLLTVTVNEKKKVFVFVASNILNLFKGKRLLMNEPTMDDVPARTRVTRSLRGRAAA